MPETKRPLKVFLCHAHSDAAAVRDLFRYLRKEGADAWLDKEKLLPGADWEMEIRKAVRESDVVVVCLSQQFNQAGFRQKEVHLALETALEKPEGEIFIIPARLEECEPPERLRKWNWVDLFAEDGRQRLIRALRARGERIGASLRRRSRKKDRDELQKVPEMRSPNSIVREARERPKRQEQAAPLETGEEKLYEVRGAPGKQIGYITGDIKNIDHVDIWVNLENTNMQMARHYEPSLSGIIRYEGATKDPNGYVVDDLIAKDLRKVTRGRDCLPGNIIVTTSGELERSNHVKRIFHAAAVIGEPGSGYRPIRDIHLCVRNALRKADSKELAPLELHSILFPLLDTGSPIASLEMANLFIDVAIEYVRQNPQSRIRNIYFLARTEQDREIYRQKLFYDVRIATTGEP